jgi:hypothetical protein
MSNDKPILAEYLKRAETAKQLNVNLTSPIRWLHLDFSVRKALKSKG